MELSGHTDDHVIEVRVEMFSLGDFQTIWRLEVVPCHDIVDIVDSSRSHSDLGEIYRPHTSIRILRLILRHVGRIDVVMDVSA